MDKLKMYSPDNVGKNIEKLMAAFPQCVAEAFDKDGKICRKVDWDLLQQELSNTLVEGNQERYTLSWPGKREAMLLANSPVAKTLRPCRGESVDFDNTKNLYIEGDNLDVLKLLQENYLGKVKMIYIDPPYNTGNDFVYEDDFSEDSESYLKKSNQKDEQGNRLVANTESNGRFHSDWLSMIYPRLKLARSLLADDGLIFISIDDNEVHNLRKLCDEIFGEDNFVANIVWEKRFTRSNNSKKFTTLTEPILCYRKTNLLDELKEPRNEKADSIYSNPDKDPRGPWTSVSCVNPATREQRPNLSYSMLNPFTNEEVIHPTNAWKFEKKMYEQYVRENKLYWGKGSENKYPRLKKFLSEMDGGMVPVDLWNHKDTGTTDQASKEVEKLLNGKFFDFPKPSSLIKRMLKIINGNGIVLDFFSGSATTADAVMQLNAEDGGNRRFIMVQLPEVCDEKSEAYKAGYKNICEIGKERIRRAGRKIQEELNAKAQNHKEKAEKNKDDLFAAGEKDNSSSPKNAPDFGFRVLKLDSSNMRDVYYTPDAIKQEQLELFESNIKDDRSPEDLLFQVMLDWGLDLALPVTAETVHGKTVFFVDGNALAACFDDNVAESVVKAIAQKKPLRVVFRDSSFATDSTKINVEEIFKLLSPSTEVKAI